MKNKIYDIIVIGGGVVGCAIMRQLTLRGLKPLLLEKGGDILSGASKANSAIMHTGYDAPEGSLELELMQKGYKEYLEIHSKFNLPLYKSDAHVVAWTDEELSNLGKIVEKAHRNNVKSVKKISKEELFKKESNLSKKALGAVYVPGEYVIDSWSSPLAYLTQAIEHGATYKFNEEVVSGDFSDSIWTIKTKKNTFKAKYIINSAGLYGDKIESICNANPPFTIKPRKGQFVVLDKSSNKLINSIILPVPTKLTKGVLLSRTIYGNMIVGPTAQEQESRTEAIVEHDILGDLLEKGAAKLPKILNTEVTSTFAGLRTATEHNNYQISTTNSKNWICVAGIRSTGLTAALGIASYVWELLDNNFEINSTPIEEKDVIWPQMPMLYNDGLRDFQKENSGEILCHCEQVTKREVNEVFSSKVVPDNVGGVKRRTRAMMGVCNGFNCAHKFNKVYSENKGINEELQEYDVIIIGAGPTGLGVARSLEKANANYLILDRESYIGGIPITCKHLSFGLVTYKIPMTGTSFINRLKKKIDIDRVKLNTSVIEISEDGIIKARNTKGTTNYKAKHIVLATGCKESNRNSRLVSGLRPYQIFTTGSIQRLITDNQELPFKKPAIVGTEIVSLSAIVSCTEHGAKPVAMIEESNSFNSFPLLKILPVIKGIPIMYNSQIKNIKGVENVKYVKVDTKGTIKDVACDAVIFTGKFVAENNLVKNSFIAKYIKNGILKVDSKKRVDNLNIWSCGNMQHPGKSGDLCYKEGIALGKKILS